MATVWCCPIVSHLLGLLVLDELNPAKGASAKRLDLHQITQAHGGALSLSGAYDLQSRLANPRGFVCV